jgi:hypothetical protein
LRLRPIGLALRAAPAPAKAGAYIKELILPKNI